MLLNVPDYMCLCVSICPGLCVHTCVPMYPSVCTHMCLCVLRSHTYVPKCEIVYKHMSLVHTCVSEYVHECVCVPMPMCACVFLWLCMYVCHFDDICKTDIWINSLSAEYCLLDVKAVRLRYSPTVMIVELRHPPSLNMPLDTPLGHIPLSC